jgi:hypothetical protein
MIKFFHHIQQCQFEYSEGTYREHVAAQYFSIQSGVPGVTRSDKILGL